MSTKSRGPAPDPPADTTPVEPESATRLDRRRAVRRIYTAPALLTLLLPVSVHGDHHIGSPPPPPWGHNRAGPARTRRER